MNHEALERRSCKCKCRVEMYLLHCMKGNLQIVDVKYPCF